MHSLLKFAALLTVSAGGFLAAAPAISTPAEAVVCARGVRGAARLCPGRKCLVTQKRTDGHEHCQQTKNRCNFLWIQLFAVIF